MVENFHSIKLNVLIKQTKYFCSTNCWKIWRNLDAWPRHAMPRHAIPNKTHINTTHTLTQSQKNRRKTHYTGMNASMLIFILFISLLFIFFSCNSSFSSRIQLILHTFIHRTCTVRSSSSSSRRSVKKLCKWEKRCETNWKLNVQCFDSNKLHCYCLLGPFPPLHLTHTSPSLECPFLSSYDFHFFSTNWTLQFCVILS